MFCCYCEINKGISRTWKWSKIWRRLPPNGTYLITMTLLVYSAFRHVRTNREKVCCINHGCLSICHSCLHWMDSRYILYRGRYGNLSITFSFVLNRSNMPAIVATTSQSCACGHDQVPRVVLHLVQCHLLHLTRLWRTFGSCLHNYTSL
jgi:hypothetical protein